MKRMAGKCLFRLGAIFAFVFGLITWHVTDAVAALPGGTLDLTTVPKYVTPLVIPPAMPRTAVKFERGTGLIDHYEIAVRQFQQQILPAGKPQTTVWSYGMVP